MPNVLFFLQGLTNILHIDVVEHNKNKITLSFTVHDMRMNPPHAGKKKWSYYAYLTEKRSAAVRLRHYLSELSSVNHFGSFFLPDSPAPVFKHSPAVIKCEVPDHR